MCHVVWEISSSLGGEDIYIYIYFFFFNISPFLFILFYFSGCNGSSLPRRLSLVAERGVTLELQCTGFSLQQLLSFQS